MYNDSTALSGVGVFFIIIALGLSILMIISMWKIYVKAGKPGWGSIIPIYNLILLLEIVKRPGWWLILLLIVPVANLVCSIIMLFDLAKSFGKGTGFGFGLLFLGIIFYSILAFGDAEYTPIER